MGWPGPVLTDSGGYQIFSLPGDRTIDEEGARFTQLHRRRACTCSSPERSIEMQTAIGSDIMMVLDECIDSTADEAAHARGHGAHPPLGAAQPGGAAANPAQALFAIVQGGAGAGAAPRIGGVPHRSTPSTASPSAGWRWATPAPSART